MFEGLSKSGLLKEARKALNDAVSADSKFVREAKDDFGFRDGWGQWTTEEKRLLERDNRAALTMNILRPTVELVQGMYDDYRVRFFPVPVEPNDGPQCEVLDKVASVVYEDNDVISICDVTQESATICGRGWTYVDYYPDPRRPGFIHLDIGNASSLEVKVDPAARNKDLSDASYIVWPKWVRIEDFKVRYPEYAKHVENVMQSGKMLKPFLDEPSNDTTGQYDILPDAKEVLEDYTEPIDMNFYDARKHQVRVIHMEYWQNFKRYYRYSPEDGKFVEFDKSEIKSFEKLYPVLYGVPFTYDTVTDKKVKWLQFLGDKIIYDDDSPIPYDGFSLVPCLAFADSSKKTPMHYGVVRPLKDPQKELNKRWSQYINLLNKQVQPGVFVEEGAFVDEKQGESSLHTPGDTTYLNEGGLEKIKERSVPQIPVAALQLMEHSKEITRWISGLNENLYGFTGDTYQSSVVFQLRQSQGVTILRPLYKNFKKHDEEVYRRILAVVANVMQSAQIVEILGQNFDVSNIDLTALGDIQYNVDIEELPGSQTKKALENAAYIEMLQYGFPVDPTVVIDNLSISESKKQHWIEYIQQQQQAQMEQAQKQYELEMAKIQAKMKTDADKLGLDASVDSAKIEQSAIKAVRRHEIEKEQLATTRRGQELDFLARTAQQAEADETA